MEAYIHTYIHTYAYSGGGRGARGAIAFQL